MARLPLILLCLSACSTTHVVRPITVEAVEQIKAEVLGNSVVVDYTSGTPAKPSAARSPRPAVAQAEQIRTAENVLTGVSLEWMRFGTPTDGYQTIASSRVQRIRLTERGRGTINGLFYGVLAGVAGGALVGAIKAGGCTESGNGYYRTTTCPSMSGAIMGYGILGGMGGGLLGVLAGAMVGYRTTFVF